MTASAGHEENSCLSFRSDGDVGYSRGLRVAGAGSLNGFRLLLLGLLELLGLASLSLPILLEDDLPILLMEPKKELLLLVPELPDILVVEERGWFGKVEDICNSATAMNR
jgi:hypothetical protein